MLSKCIGYGIFVVTYGWIFIRFIRSGNWLLIAVASVFFGLGMFYNTRSLIKYIRERNNDKN